MCLSALQRRLAGWSWFSQEEAHGLKHNYIGTRAHPARAIASAGRLHGLPVLGSFDVTLERVRDQIVRLVGSGGKGDGRVRFRFTPRVKKVSSSRSASR